MTTTQNDFSVSLLNVQISPLLKLCRQDKNSEEHINRYEVTIQATAIHLKYGQTLIVATDVTIYVLAYLLMLISNSNSNVSVLCLTI